MSETEKTVLVTGASRGIGRAVCVKFAREGYNVAVNYAGNQAEAVKTKALCEEYGVKAVIVQADVSDYTQCEAMFEKITAELGGVDVLVNNAGVTKDGMMARMSEEDFDRVIDVNVKGTFICTKLAYRGMAKKRWGRIVNISSVVGLTGNGGQANYAASKAGIIGFTKSVAKEFAGRGILVNAVAPGFIETDMTGVLSEDVQSAIRANIPLSRFGKPEEVAETVFFLCSEQAAYITGQTLAVDGGMTMV